MAVTVPLVDDFNRASIGSNWTGIPYGDSAIALSLTGSTVINGHGYAASWWNQEHLRVDNSGWTIELAVDVPTLPGTNALGFALGLVLGPGATSADGYEFDVVKTSGSTHTFTIYRVTNASTLVSIGSGTTTLAGGETIWVRRTSAGVFTFGKIASGVETTVATSSADTTYTGALFPFLGVFDTAVRLDNFCFGRINLTGGTLPPYMASKGITATASGTTLAVDIPLHVAGDVLVIQGAKNGAADLTMSGWTEIVPAQNSANFSTGWWWKRATTGSETATLTSSTSASASDGLYAQCHRFRGCVATGDPFEDATANGSPTSSSTPTWATFDTSGPDRLAVLFSIHDDDPGASSGYPPSGWGTPALGSSGTTVGGDCRAMGSWRQYSSASTVTGGTTWTMGGTAYWRVLGLAFLPATTAVVVTGSPATATAAGETATPRTATTAAAATAAAAGEAATGQVRVTAAAATVAAAGEAAATGAAVAASPATATAAGEDATPSLARTVVADPGTVTAEGAEAAPGVVVAATAATATASGTAATPVTRAAGDAGTADAAGAPATPGTATAATAATATSAGAAATATAAVDADPATADAEGGDATPSSSGAPVTVTAEPATVTAAGEAASAHTALTAAAGAATASGVAATLVVTAAAAAATATATGEVTPAASMPAASGTATIAGALAGLVVRVVASPATVTVEGGGAAGAIPTVVATADGTAFAHVTAVAAIAARATAVGGRGTPVTAIAGVAAVSTADGSQRALAEVS